MTIRFFTDIEDYIAFSAYYIKKTPEGRRAMLRERMRAPIMIALAVFMFMAAFGELPPTFLLVELLIIAAILYFLWPAINRYKVRRSYVKFAASGDIEAGEETVMEFEDEHFTKTLPDAMRRLSYSWVRLVSVEKDYIFITVRGRQTIVIPRRCMADGGDALVALLKEKCGEAKFAG